MLIRKPADIPSSEITDEKVFRNRRQFMTAAGLASLASVAGLTGCGSPPVSAATRQISPDGPFDTDEPLTPEAAVTGYNNFYEFGTGKPDPAQYAGALHTSPWSVRVDGLVENPGKVWDLEALLRGFTMEDRIYRMRCVEAWSMVIPWYGFPMADLINRLQPLPSARYVRMETLVRPDEMIGQRPGLFGAGLDWPYVEGLRMDEAMHPLTFMAVGVYGHEGPNQNGAPLRVVIPWKYGFKGIKSIVRISFTEDQPLNTWKQMQGNEYGFYANVNPNVDHPRWSQKTEKRITTSSAGFTELFASVQPTRMFNGYADQVAQLYDGMDLRVNF
jgi:methionine sulfoxide reductase catalytic subunit